MHLFTRTVTLKASPTRWMPWAAEITGTVNRLTGLGTGCWAAQYGAPLGTLGFTAVVESEAALAEAAQTLAVDSGYLELLEQAQGMDATAEDHLWTVVHGARAGTSTPGAIGLMTTATAVPDRYLEAIQWGVEIAQLVESITQRPVTVLTGMYGAMGSMAWVGVTPDLATHHAVGAQVVGNVEYAAKMQSS